MKGGGIVKKSDVTKIIGLAGMLLGGVATLISGYAQQKAMEEEIDRQIQEAIEKLENER